MRDITFVILLAICRPSGGDAPTAMSLAIDSLVRSTPFVNGVGVAMRLVVGDRR